MPNVFTDRYTGVQRHYVSKTSSEPVQARTEIDFGFTDNKGRAIGMSRAIRLETVELEEGEHQERNNRLHVIGAPTRCFVGFAHGLRAGQVFGSSYIRIEGATETEVAAELDKRIERARKAAERKYSA